MANDKAGAVEITRFRLAPGVSLRAFIAANRDVDAWLRRQPGFIARRICTQEDGWIVDVLRWSSVAAGRRAMRGLMSELGDSPVHAAIDQSTVAWSIARVVHSLSEESGES